MQYVKARKDLIFALNPLGVLIGLLLSWFYARDILLSFYVFWIAAIVAILLFVTSLGSRRLIPPQAEIIPFPGWFWLSCIIVIELSVCGMYWGMSRLAGEWFLVNTLSHPRLFSNTMAIYLADFGLFPWTLYAVITVSMAALAYRQQTHAYFSNLLKPFFRQHPQEPLGLIANVSLRRCVVFALGITVMFFTLLLMSFMNEFDTHIANGFRPSTLLTTSILLLLSVTPFIKIFVRRLFSRNIPTGVSLPMLSLVLAVAILFLSATSFGLFSHDSVLQNVPDLVVHIIQKNWVVFWLIFSTLWWLCLTPVICSVFARLSIGYRIREVIMGILILPLIVYLLYLSHGYTQIVWPDFSLLWVQIISLLSFLIGLPLLLSHRRSSNAILAYFPKNGVEKPRDHYPFFERVAQFATVAFYFYLVIGINALAIYLFSFTYFVIIGSLLATVSVFKNIR